MRRSEALSALKTLVWNSVLLCPNPKATLPSLKLPKAWGERREAVPPEWRLGIRLLTSFPQASVSVLSATRDISAVFLCILILTSGRILFENWKTILLDWSDKCSYVVQAMPLQTPHHASDPLPFLDDHIWKQLISLSPSLVIFIWIRVKWLLISPLIATCFLYNESLVWYWYFRAMQISYSPWNERIIDYSCLNPSTGMFAKGWFSTSKLSLHSSLGNPL